MSAHRLSTVNHYTRPVEPTPRGKTGFVLAAAGHLSKDRYVQAVTRQLSPEQAEMLQQRMGQRAWQAWQLRAAHAGPAPRGWKHRWFYRGLAGLFHLAGLYDRGQMNFRNLRRYDLTLTVPGLPRALEGQRWLVLSDLHLNLDPQMGERVQAIVAAIEEPVQGTWFLGDWLTADRPLLVEQLEQLPTLIEALPGPVYAVSGNHDWPQLTLALEAATGLRYLHNEVVQLGEGYYLAGLAENTLTEAADLTSILTQLPEGAACTLLAHSPAAYLMVQGSRIRSMLCGHTHGGQIALPGGHALIAAPPGLPRACLRGGWHLDGIHGYTTMGISGAGLPIRYFSQPEIVVATLSAEREA